MNVVLTVVKALAKLAVMFDRSVRSRRPGARVLAGRWLVVLAAFAGLFAMHGLSDHGVGMSPVGGAGAAHAHHGAISAVDGAFGADVEHTGRSPVADQLQQGRSCNGTCTSGGTAASRTSADHSAAEAAGLDPGLDAGQGQSGHGGGASGFGHGMDLMGLCLAVLVAAALTVLGVRRGSWRISARALAAAVASAGGILAATSRVLDPPDLHRLSIARC
ncbi:hypothetical protein G6553_07055 [Nocardioides sp. IC4_145]|uniref:hypothetical protein n=1 Tax=Nocardioides sp. IC4_145 TaxID=2714037 RepID=UPI001407ECC1|nr:hypothetical protein [Nocardioides sp. IC4_145]NHC22929.1 hypothetical protein [Nocardioides sp. IC4_145]